MAEKTSWWRARGHTPRRRAAAAFGAAGGPAPQVFVRGPHSHEEEFAALSERYLERVYRFIFFQIPDEQAVEDLTLAAFVRTWDEAPTPRLNESAFRVRVFRNARMLVLNHSAPATEPPVASSVAAARDNPGTFPRLRAALQLMSRPQQQVLILRFVVQLSLPEIAQVLNLRRQTIQAVQTRALRTLQGALARARNVSAEP